MTESKIKVVEIDLKSIDTNIVKEGYMFSVSHNGDEFSIEIPPSSDKLIIRAYKKKGIYSINPIQLSLNNLVDCIFEKFAIIEEIPLKKKKKI